MQEVAGFKERVKTVMIASAKVYKQNYVDYEYLICSDAFSLKDYYVSGGRVCQGDGGLTQIAPNEKAIAFATLLLYLK